MINTSNQSFLLVLLLVTIFLSLFLIFGKFISVPQLPQPEDKPCGLIANEPCGYKACGGFAGETGEFACPSGYYCKYPKPIYPDAQGVCVKKVQN